MTFVAHLNVGTLVGDVVEDFDRGVGSSVFDFD